MASFKLFICLIAITSAQVFAGRHPHPRSSDEDIESDLHSFRQKYLSNSRQQNVMYSQQPQSYVRNQVIKIPQVLMERSPMASDVLGMSKDNLMRLPLEKTMKALSEVCHSAISTESFVPNYAPEQNEINLHVMSESEDNAVPLRNINQLWNTPNYDSSKGLVLYINGWKSNPTDQDDSLDVLRKAFNRRGTENFVAIDIGSLIDNYYAYQTFNIELIGQWIGDALAQMRDRMQTIKFNLIGHGIGAHVAGVAGRRYTELTGNQLPRITGLDPALLCYKNHENVVELNKGDAKFVDVIHSNSYGLGNPVPMGDVDFYPNRRWSKVPGCDNVMCAHERAVQYYAETVVPGNEENFMAKRNNNQQNVPMGYATPSNTRGIFYLETNPQYPFGKQSGSGYSKTANSFYY